MIQYLAEQLKGSKNLQIITVFFAILTVWWLSIFFRGLAEGPENNAFTLIYPLLSLIGGVAGLSFAKKWGGLKSVLGGSITYFSAGILAQFAGQALYSYYIYVLGVEVPYPSVGDVAFFGSVVFYIFGVVQLAKVSGLRLSFATLSGKVQAFIIPLIVLFLSYWIFLNGYEPDWSDWVVTFLDFGYPIGQVVYVSIALLALLISKNILGGVMRKPIMLLIMALIVQYIADFHFSYQASRDTWYVGGTNDFIFAFAYFLMAISLFSIGNMFYKVKDS